MTITADKIATALGRATYTETEEAQWELWISDALLLIKARLGDPDELDEAKLDYVVREAVVAHVRNPDNATQVTVSVDDASSSRSYRSSKGRVTILDEWWALLAPERTGGIFAVDMLGGAWDHSSFCDLAFGGGSCSCGAVIAGHPIYGEP